MNDLISRQNAIDAIKALWDGAPTAQHVSAMFDCEDAIQTLPSAEPEIIHCRECQHWKQGELVDKCGLLDCYADADCYCAWAVRERRQQ